MAFSPERYVEWRAENRERLSAYHRDYYEKNKERLLAENRKRSKERGYSGISNMNYRSMVIDLLYQRDGDLCGIRGDPVAHHESSVDHINPRCMGGGDEADNLRLAHRTCNIRRERGNRKWQGQTLTSSPKP